MELPTAIVLAEKPFDYAGLTRWTLVLVAVCFVAFIVVSIVRRRSEEYRKSQVPPPFTLSDLREMHASGQLSDEEFDRAKEKMLNRARHSVGVPPEVAPPPTSVNPEAPKPPDTPINPDSSSPDASPDR